MLSWIYQLIDSYNLYWYYFVRVQLIFWKCCHENLSFLNLLLGEKGWKHVAQQISPVHSTIYFPVTENKFIVWNYSFSGPTSIYLFKFCHNKSRIKCQICSKLTIEALDIVLVLLLLTLNIYVSAGWNTLLPQSKFI